MRIEIEIPKEFEEHFTQDKFRDSFERIVADIKHSLENGSCLCSGRYEYETIEMLKKAFDDSKTAYDVDKVVRELEKAKTINVDVGFGTIYKTIRKDVSIEIVKKGGVSDDACEWTKYDYKTIRSPHERDWSIPSMKDFKFCPCCGKKIKVVDGE